MSYGKFGLKMPITNYNPRMSEAWNTGAAIGNLLGTLWGENYQRRGEKKTYEAAQEILNNMGKQDPASDSLYQDYSNLNISAAEPQASTKATDANASNTTSQNVPSVGIGDIRAIEKANFTKNYIDKYKTDPNAVGNTIAGTNIAETVNRNLKNLNAAQAPSFKAADMRAAIEAELMRRNKPAGQIANAMKLIEPQILAKEQEYNSNKVDELYQQYMVSNGKDIKTLAELSKYNPQLAKMLYDDAIYSRNRAATIADRNATFAQQKEMLGLKTQAALDLDRQRYNEQRQRLFNAIKNNPDYAGYTDAQIYSAVDQYMLGMGGNSGSTKSKKNNSGSGNIASDDPFAFGGKSYQQVLAEYNALKKKQDNGMTPLSNYEKELLAQYDNILKQSRKNAFGSSEGVSKDVDFMLGKLQQGQASGMTNSQIKSSVLGAFQKGTPQYKAAEDAFTAAVALSGAQQDPASMGMGLGYGNVDSTTPTNTATLNYGGGGGGYDSPSVTEAIISGTQSVEPQAPNNVADFRRANDNSPAPVTATVEPQGVLNSMGDFRMAEAAMPQNFVSRRQPQLSQMSNEWITGDRISYTPQRNFSSTGAYADASGLLSILGDTGKGGVGETVRNLRKYLGDVAGMEISKAIAGKGGNYGDVPADLQSRLQAVMDAQKGNTSMALPTSFGSGPSYLTNKAEAAQVMPNLSPKVVQQVMDAENPDVVLYDKKPTTGNSQGITMFYADEASRNFNPGHSEGKEGIHYGTSSLVNRVRDLYGLVPYRESDGTNCARTVSVALNGTPYSGMYNVDQFVATAKKNGQLYKVGEGYVPKAGDLAVTNNGNHIVMVTENGGTIQNGASGNKGKGGIYETNEPPEQQRGGVQYYISTSDYERVFPNFYFNFDIAPSLNAIGNILRSTK